MQLPIDIPAVLKAATDIEAAAKTPLSVSVLIDDAAPLDCAGHVRAAFASAGPHTRVTIAYLGDGLAAVPAGDDFAVIVAGASPAVGESAARIRAAGVPVMVATTQPSLVHDVALEAGHPIPEGDICSPEGGAAPSALVRAVQERLDPAAAEGCELDLDEDVAEAVGGEGSLTEEGAEALDLRMGRWICAACDEKKLACALAFPFVRRPLALDAVRATAIQNAAVGAAPIIPGADMPIMTLNQMKMLLQIAAAYGQPLNAERVKELAAVLGGAFLLRNVARTAAGFVPVLGWAVRGAVGFGGTEAMGWAAIEYFEGGGDLAGAAAVVQNGSAEAAKAVRQAAATPAGQGALKAVKGAAGRARDLLRSKAKSK